MDGQRNRALQRTRALHKFHDVSTSWRSFQRRTSHCAHDDQTVRSQMLEKIHSSHIGAEGCLRRAREVVFCPSITAEVKEYVSSCDTCNAHRHDHSKESLIPVLDHHEWLLISLR